jgi:hypothetical protein
MRTIEVIALAVSGSTVYAGGAFTTVLGQLRNRFAVIKDGRDYLASFTTMSTGSTTWCAGETRSATVTVTNTGTATWVAGAVNLAYWWNGQGQDTHPRISLGTNLAPGESRTLNVNITAPAAPGAQHITFDVVKEGDCWFRSNHRQLWPRQCGFCECSAITVAHQPNLRCHRYPQQHQASAMAQPHL